MPRRIFILCETDEQELKEVHDVCLFAQEHNILIHFPANPGWDFYKVIEEWIEQCDTFVVVVSQSLHGGTWMLHCLDYADILRKYRFNSRPRILGLKIDNMELSHGYKQLEIEWINSSDDYKLILEDIPQNI